MATKTCGCSTANCAGCDCCEGVQQWTPAPRTHRPGLPALNYRVGVHGEFFETMKARLATMRLDAPGADGQTIETFQPLLGLTARETSDMSIALLDGWATTADVITFYQERIANEGFLRTATERRSILELARLVGYSLRPGVASTVFLVYTIDENQIEPVEIPVGSRSQSIPGPDELPQSFETKEKFLARADWNNLQVRLNRPQDITLENSLKLDKIFLAGINASLKTGDLVAFKFGETESRWIVRIVAKIEVQAADNRTEIWFQPVPQATVVAFPALIKLVNKIGTPNETDFSSPTNRVRRRAGEILAESSLGAYSDPSKWADAIENAADGTIDSVVQNAIDAFRTEVEDELKKLGDQTPKKVVTDPAEFVPRLLIPPIQQPPSSQRLGRSLQRSFDKGSDVSSQLLVNFESRLKDSYYRAWANANVNDAKPVLKAVYAFRASAPLFGATVQKQPTYDGNNKLNKVSLWEEWPLSGDEATTSLFLDQANESILPDSYVLIQMKTSSGSQRMIHQVISGTTTTRTAYGISGKTTQLTFEKGWWSGDQDSMETLRGTLVYSQSEELALAEEPITTDVDGQEIELAGLFNELVSGRWVILSGERADIPGVSGVKVSELLMISGLTHSYDADLPGDKTHTFLTLATSTAYKYKRQMLKIYANVVKATHGETRNETLGGGDGSQALQAFTLKQPPLTFVPASTPSGVESTLKVYVNDVEWDETETLAGLGEKDRVFIAKTDDEARTTVIFGNGKEGARLPTGVENVKAVYRNGIGKGGNVRAEQISLLQSRPLGVKAVINPLRASGGADKESRDLARENAPLAVMALDRLVSVRDYADFTRTFAGIAKADARRLSNGRQRLIHLTIASADDIPIDPESDLYLNLIAALRHLGDSDLPVQVDSRELVALVLSARLRLAPGYLWDTVVDEVRRDLMENFGFHKRALGQPVFLSEVVSLIQHINGVAYVDVESLIGVPEKKVVEEPPPISGQPLIKIYRLLTADELSAYVTGILSPPPKSELPLPRRPANQVLASAAKFDNGLLRPAQLAIFSPAVPDTIVLNQII